MRASFGMRRGRLIAAMWFLAMAAPAAAQGLFDSLLTSRPPQTATSAPPAPAASPPPAPLASAARHPSAPATGFRGAAYCVRLCDGRFFPMEPHANIAPLALCRALCPASAIKVFHGGDIAQASAADGGRYGDLKTAYLFRKTLVQGCTCNGKDAFGLAPIDVDADPTLRVGDLVARTDSASPTGSTPVAAHPLSIRGVDAGVASAAAAPQNYPAPVAPVVRTPSVSVRPSYVQPTYTSPSAGAAYNAPRDLLTPN